MRVEWTGSGPGNMSVMDLCLHLRFETWRNIIFSLFFGLLMLHAHVLEYFYEYLCFGNMSVKLT